MSVVLERPSDRLVTGRVQLIAGRLEPPSSTVDDLTIGCRGRSLPVRGFSHPTVAGCRGFWTYLFLQELHPLPESLELTFFRSGRRVDALQLRIAPTARTMAREFPLDLRDYPIAGPEPTSLAPPPPFTVVFPGLFGIGGSSLNELARLNAYRMGWEVALFYEANDPAVWEPLCARDRPPVRWIDGHDCYEAAKLLNRSFARITLLREPEQRLLSVFNYARLVHPGEIRFQSFEEFVCSPMARSYTMAAQLLRIGGRTLHADAPGGDLYAAAREELERGYALVGITEAFEETLFLVGRLAGWSRIPLWWRVLSAPDRPRLELLDRKTRRRLDEILAPDRQLYEEARVRFQRLLQQASFGTSMEAYKSAAARQPELTPDLKFVECLRWRQQIAEERLQQLRPLPGPGAPGRAFGGASFETTPV